MVWRARWPVAFLCVALSAGCRKASHQSPVTRGEQPWFSDVSRQTGVNSVHDCGATGSYFMPQIMGSGVALFDFDNDGRLDILLLNNGGPSGAKNKLYHQERDGTFRDVSEGSGLDFAGYAMGVAVGDINNDGLPDVLVTQYTGVRLFLNRGNAHFQDVTREAGLDDPHWATSAGFFDYDRDGRLDLVVANYVAYSPSRVCTDPAGDPDYCGPRDFEGTVTKLYHNVGAASASDVPRFIDVTERSGIAAAPARGLGVLCADFDGDGWPDVFIANDAQANHLWINRHDGTFREEAEARGVAYAATGQPMGNMGVTIADLRGNGFFDLFVTHLTHEGNTLWQQAKPGAFADRTSGAGLDRRAGTGFGAAFADFDNDGLIDLAVVNGRVTRGAPVDSSPAVGTLPPYWRAYAESNQLFRALGDGTFRDISAGDPGLCGETNVARGLAAGDVFNDGGICLLFSSVGGPARLLRNVTPNRGHWITLRAIDPALAGRDAYGAEIRIRAHGRTQTGWVNAACGYLSSSDPRVHFGLGRSSEIQQIQVRWPDGSQEEFAGPPADQCLTLRKGSGDSIPIVRHIIDRK